MSNILHEEAFLIADLKSIINKSTDAGDENVPKGSAGAGSDAKPEATAEKGGAAAEAAGGDGIKDWGAELERRLAENDKLSPEARVKPFLIEKRFWNEYFTTVFGTKLASALSAIGTLLREDISDKDLGGFSKENPIVAFISSKHVLKNIIATKLLNVSTYEVIHDILEQDLIPESEFKNGDKNTYNIIYCKDFYTKSPDEMRSYLKIQKAHLGRHSSYTADIQDLNKRIFLQLSENTESDTTKRVLAQLEVGSEELPTVKDADAKLNSVSFAAQVYNYLKKHRKDAPGGSNDSATGNKGGASNQGTAGNQGNAGSGREEREAGNGQERLNDLYERANSLGEIFALLQYASMVSNSTAVQKVLGNSKFSSLDAAKIRAGAINMAPYTKGLKLSAAEATALASMLSGKRVKKEKNATADKPSAPMQRLLHLTNPKQ